MADVAAVVSGPSEVLQRLSLARRSDESHSLLFPRSPNSEILSLAAIIIIIIMC